MIGFGGGGACATQNVSGQHIDITGIAFNGGINQSGDVKTGDVDQNGNCQADGGTVKQHLAIPIPVGLMNLMIQNPDAMNN